MTIERLRNDLTQETMRMQSKRELPIDLDGYTILVLLDSFVLLDPSSPVNPNGEPTLP